MTQTQDNKLTLKQRSSETKFINKTQIARQNKVKANQDQEQIIKTGGKQQQQDVKTFRDMRRVETLQKGTQNHDNQDKSWIAAKPSHKSQVHLLYMIII